ncbi:MAG: TIGR03749 family integrating conjugative element protein [Legionellales bacterium]|nr:TIGR03749 family integrating conjugative element protein [Legionellales bacterium]
MNRIIQLCCLASIFTLSLGTASIGFAESQPLTRNQSDQHVVWKREPIQITLPVGVERFVTFPTKVQFGYNTSFLPSSVLRVENDNRTLYLFAKKPFSTERVEAKLASGEIILLDINAKAHANDNPVDIVLPKSTPVSSTTQSQFSAASVNYVTLTRYAIQQIYAPERLLKQSINITRFPMETAHVVPLFYDGSATAMPLASWRGGNLYVTALLIKNVLSQSLRLDPRLLCGTWLAASFYPQTTLAPHGTPINRDTSILFVVSSQPFAQAIQACAPQT